MIRYGTEISDSPFACNTVPYSITHHTMSSQRSISVAFDLHPPSGLPASSNTDAIETQPLATSSKMTYTITPTPPSASSSSSSSRSETSVYYTALSERLQTAQLELNEKLTKWKDVIGDKEKMKEDPGTPGFGRGKASMMSEGVMMDANQGEGGDSEEV
jgi:hypothetical protein